MFWFVGGCIIGYFIKSLFTRNSVNLMDVHKILEWDNTILGYRALSNVNIENMKPGTYLFSYEVDVKSNTNIPQ